jgi:short-subunit dehydrogenase
MGQAIAGAFAKQGFDLVLISRNSGNISAIAGDIGAGGTKVHTYEADAVWEEQIKEQFQTIMDQVGVPEVLVYNPAIIAEEKPSELTPEKLRPFFEVMLYGAVNSVNAVLPAMRARGSGTLLFTGGGFAIDPSVSLSSHSVAKAALRNYSQALYKELEPEGLHAATVTITRPVEPGKDMENAAAQFVKLYRQRHGHYDWEIVYGD